MPGGRVLTLIILDSDIGYFLTRKKVMVLHKGYIVNECVTEPKEISINKVNWPSAILQRPVLIVDLKSLFLWLIDGIELASKISCDSPDSFGHMMRNYWTEQQKSNDYIQKEETERFHFGQ
ncbi:hypothetical protein BTVI_124502 [Pitangus sulphuratus]|nr:hypothetical protein BTVI_124502 [Pitangus sulphuratus]